MDSLRVEYMVVVETKNNFCNSIKAFNHLLEGNDSIQIEKGKKIKFKNLEIQYNLQTGELSDKEQRFFHMKFTLSQIDKINEFTSFLKIIKETVHTTTNKVPISLWDDTSFYYANMAYPLIHEIENLMRKFLTKFSITKLGSNWTEKNIPEEVIKSTRKRDPNEENKEDKNSQKKNVKGREANVLYQTDFIQLLNFLSEKINTSDAQEIIKIVKKAKNVSDINLEELKAYIPTNNWDKYFSSIVDFNLEYLEDKWKKLYELRCKVAHNNYLNKKDFEDICKYVEELKPKLQKVIDEMDKVILSEEDQDIIAESFAMNTNTLYGEYINKWKYFEKVIFDLVVENDKDINSKELAKYRYSPARLINILKEKNIISNEIIEKVNFLRQLRNTMVHEVQMTVDESQIRIAIEMLNTCLNEIKNIKKMV